MRAMVIDRFGGPEELHLAEVPPPLPGPGQVVIRLAFAGVNPADWKCREGWFAPYHSYAFPFILGLDGAGIISAVAPDVTAFKLGERVATKANQADEWGTYAEYVRTTAGRVGKIAPNVSYRDAATVPTAAISAFEGIDFIGRVKVGQLVLVHGGAGGVGSFAIQMAKHIGARVAATCGPDNVEYVRSLGAELAINYRSDDVVGAVRGWAPGGVDFLFDCVGQGTLLGGFKVVRRGGTLGYINTVAKGEPRVSEADAAQAGIKVAMVSSNPSRLEDQLQRILHSLNNCELRAPAIEVMPLEKAGEAHRRVKEGHVRGKIALKIADLD